MTAAGSVAVFGGGAAAPSAPAAAVVVLAAGPRVLGLPRVAFLAATAVVVTAIAAVAVVLTVSSGNDSNTAANREPVATSAARPAEATTTLPVAGFSGTYSVVRTITSVPPTAPDPVGTTSESTWTVTSTCPSGPCDVNVASSTGLSYNFVYGDGVWRSEIALELECFDRLGPTGETVASTDMLSLVPGAPSDSSADAPLATLSGTTTETIAAGCDGDPGGTFELALLLTRIGD